MGRRGLGPVLIWTVSLLGLAVLLAAHAVTSLYEADQACFFDYPALACPGIDDARVAELRLALFGIPLVWLVGVGVACLARAVRRRRREEPPRSY